MRLSPTTSTVKQGDALEKKLNAILLLILTFFLAIGAGCADSGGMAVAGKVGTLGLGGELTTAVTELKDNGEPNLYSYRRDIITIGP